MFSDRASAGRQLGQALEHYKDAHALVLAIPKGGIPVACAVAGHLGADLSLLIARKLPFPDNPEAGFGAIAEDGSTFIFPAASCWFPRPLVEEIARQQRQEIARRIEVLRGGEPLPDISSRTVILVDDGLATGATMRAAIQLCRRGEAGKVVVAVPVAGEETMQEVRPLVDDLVVLESPPDFRAVAQVFRHWHDISDEEALAILAHWRRERQ